MLLRRDHAHQDENRRLRLHRDEIDPKYLFPLGQFIRGDTLRKSSSMHEFDSFEVAPLRDKYFVSEEVEGS